MNEKLRIKSEKYKLIEFEGITLISLVITIIILIILAGVAINLSIGENGIFRRAKEARDKYLTAEEKEQQQLNELYAQLNTGNEPENTPETEAGIRVKLPSGWVTISPNYVSTEDGKVVKKMTISSNVYAVSGGKGVTVPVPEGFYYVGGDIDTGIVISDNKADGYETTKKDMTSHEESIKLVGNQFVWIPCTEKEYNITDFNNNDCYYSLETAQAEKVQIRKYGGFYVARYESGLPIGKTEYKGNQEPNSEVYNFEGIPQSKAGILPWNFISWNNAAESSINMYKTNNYVHSGLITGTQWDVILNKIEYFTDKKLEESVNWGNYSDSPNFNYNGRAANAEYDGTSYKVYEFGEIQNNAIKSSNEWKLLTTGASEKNKSYNLYDIAGNLNEWTEESALNNSMEQIDTNKVLRGGSYTDEATQYDVTYRYINTKQICDWCLGFRVVLYIK